MVSLEAALALSLATVALVALPGPNVAVIAANTLRHGLGYGLLTVAGTTVGIALQLTAVIIGLATVLDVIAGAMVWIKWIGVGYLLYLGIQAWTAPDEQVSDTPPDHGRAVMVVWQGLGLALINPKTLLFNAAFLPQFFGDQAAPATMVVLAGLYLSILFAGDCLWAVFARAARHLAARFARVRTKVTGALFITAGIGLALARAER